MDEDINKEQKTWQGYNFGKRSVFRLDLKVQRGFLSDRKGKVIPCRRTENKKGTVTNRGESGARNLEAESVRCREESTGGCVK